MGQPLFIVTPQIWRVQIIAANTNLDGTGTLLSLASGNTAPGSRIDKIRIQGVGTVADGMIRFFLANSAGSTKHLIKEREVKATAPTGTVRGFEDEWTLQEGLTLPDPTWSVLVGTHAGNTFNIFGFGGNLG
ncbi:MULTISPECIES: hypothetical protein [unclassified Bradyrhizobium]|uniref:hypothetical protein n=1 Tax=unclassified Bradyrhizobium TaxID=2631580 RepID=UPI002916FAAE|nr:MULTISPECIES: hypothetical protein [unclassified Bradyrhizobium]